MNDVEFQQLLDAEPPITIKPSLATIGYSLGFLLVLLLITFGYVLRDKAQQHEGWGFVLFVTVPMIIIGLILTYRDLGHVLVLEKQGFTIKSLFQNQYYAWKESANFVGDVYGFFIGATQYRIYFTYKNRRLKFLHPDNSGNLSVHELADLMNRWRERALQSPMHPPSALEGPENRQPPSNNPSRRVAPEAW